MNRQPSHQDLSSESLLADTIDEMIQRLNGGEDVDLSEYTQRYPQIATPLERAYTTLVRMRQAGTSQTEPMGKDLSLDYELPGQLGDFRIRREIGRGGMGIVYEAEQMLLRRPVALKILPLISVLDA